MLLLDSPRFSFIRPPWRWLLSPAAPVAPIATTGRARGPPAGSNRARFTEFFYLVLCVFFWFLLLALGRPASIWCFTEFYWVFCSTSGTTSRNWRFQEWNGFAVGLEMDQFWIESSLMRIVFLLFFCFLPIQVRTTSVATRWQQPPPTCWSLCLVSRFP